MKFKNVLAALSGSGKKNKASSSRLDENASPLVPKRLLSPLPASSARRGGGTLADLSTSGTPRSLNYDCSPPRARLQRDASLQARASPRQPPTASALPARTPLRGQSRFGQQAAQDGAAAVAHDYALAGTDAAAAGGSDNIRVVLRVRPRNEREASLGGGTCVQPLGNGAVRVASHPEPHSFSFDYVAGDGADQETIFQVAGKPIVENCLAGYNGCIFAYGQTGSGKTYTMTGAGCDGGPDSGASLRDNTSRGLIQRVFEHLFGRIAEEGGKYLLECSFLEIYNETITDLLDPSRTNLQVRENLEGQYVSNLTAHEVYRVEDVVGLLRTGQANRRVGETNMNERSSRSHSVFTCKLQSKTVDAYGATHIRTARLHLVDLAGSERQKASGAQGERLKEATAINKSLSALGNVIMSLVDQQHGRVRHIPYRDSRLTYLLQDSLGGNAKTCLVATVSPAAVNVAETLSTLRFADQAKRIKNQAKVNEDTDGDRAALKREIKRLQEELAAARRQPAAAAGGIANSSNADIDGSIAAAPGDPPQLSGTPARLAATADSMLAAASPSTGESLGRRQALMGALRREDAALKDVKRLEAELEGMHSLLKAKESDLQRVQMMMKLKESRLARIQSERAMQGGAADVPAEVADLQREIELLRAKVEAHPEVKRFAVENLRLNEEMRKYDTIMKRDELAALHVDIDALRGEMLRMEDEMHHAQGEAALAAEQVAAARAEAEMAAERIRAKAVEETQAKAAVELSQLRQQLFEQQRAAREAEGQLCAAARDNEELHARVALLQETVAQLESTQTTLRGELSPVKRQARQWEHELGLARQETMAAEMRASSEATLRKQAELANEQLEARLLALGAEAAALRASNQELFQAKSDAEEQRDNGIEVELQALRARLEQEQAAAAEHQANHSDALAQLDASRQHACTLEQELQATQREVMEANAELQRQQAVHEAALMATAARIAAVEKVADEMRAEVEKRTARVQELEGIKDKLQLEMDDFTQRCTQLHNENVHVSSMLAQRDNELLEMEQTIEEKDVQLAQLKAGTSKLEGDLQEAKAALDARAEELESVGAELATSRAKLAEITAAMQDAHDQLAELQERLAAAEEQQAQAEYELSDKSASLSEVQEQLVEVKRQLAATREAQAVAAAAQEQQGGAVECLVAELEAAHSRAAQLAAELAEAEARVQAEQQEAAAGQVACQQAQAALEAKEEELAAQRAAAQAVQQQAGELAAQLQQLQQVTLLEKEQQLLLGKAEVKELRQQLAEQEDAAEKLRAQLEGRERDIAQLRHDIATEVSEAAQQVQQLLAAQGRLAALEAELAAAQQAVEERQAECAQLPLRMAEAVAAARADARLELERLEGLLEQREVELAALRQEAAESQSAIAEAASMTTTQAQEQIEQLVAEREAWIEEVQAQRAEATAAVEALRALERRSAELAEERASLAEALAEVQARAGKLESELTHLTGQQNLNQRIQYHKKVKEENDSLREELGRLRIEHHRMQMRYNRVAEELKKLRGDNGQEGLPDFEAEEALRDALAATEAQKQQLEKELDGLVHAVLALAPRELRQPEQQGAASAAAGEGEGEGDIVLELCTPRPGSQAASSSHWQAGTGAGGSAAVAAAAARRALADISAQQAAAARCLEDSRQQIRLLKESTKLAKLRRASGVVAAALTAADRQSAQQQE